MRIWGVVFPAFRLPYVRCIDRIADLMTDSGRQERIEELRERVDEVDRELVRVLNERARIVQELSAYKLEAGVPLFDPKREEAVLRRVAELNEGPIYDSSLRDIFELVMHRIRDIEVQRGEFQK